MHRILIRDKSFVDSRYFSDYQHFLNSVEMYKQQGYRVYAYAAGGTHVA